MALAGAGGFVVDAAAGGDSNDVTFSIVAPPCPQLNAETGYPASVATVWAAFY